MPESPSSSFIPKRGPGKKPVTVRKNNFVVLSIVSYALFVSAPLASAAVFIYERHTANQFNKAVVALDLEIASFNEKDLERVSEFDERLTISKNILAGHVSLVSLLQAIESSTAETVKFKELEIKRTDATTLGITGLLTTSAFDGALFQRSSYLAKDIISDPRFTDTTIVQAVSAAGKETDSEKTVEFKATFNFSATDVVYKPLSEAVPADGSVETAEAMTIEESDSTIMVDDLNSSETDI